MDNINKFDTSCWEMASKLSCEHMKNLAINDLNYNARIFNNNTCDPSWNRNIEDRDRNLEYSILSGFSINKKSCINKKQDYNNGCWDKQFGIYNPITGEIGCSINEVFDENSKKKMNDTKNCIEKINFINDNDNNNKKLTTGFNEDFYSVLKNKNKSEGIIDRYNNHNPVIGDEFSQPPTLNRNNPKLENDPNYKKLNNFIYPPIRNPSKSSDCSTLYNYDRYSTVDNDNMIYFEPCSIPK